MSEESEYIQSVVENEIASNFSSPDFSPLQKILDQRHNQRNTLFNFAIYATIASLLFLGFLILFQVLLRAFCNPNIRILEGFELEILSIGVFSQFLGVISIITKSLWDDSNYKDMLKDMFNNHNNGNHK